MKIELETYPPAEAEIASGLPQPKFRNWKVRRVTEGLFPKIVGRARYDAIDIATMYVMEESVNRGIYPGQAKKFAREAGQAAFYHMAGWISAYPEGAFEIAGPWARDLPEPEWVRDLGDIKGEIGTLEVKPEDSAAKRLDKIGRKFALDVAMAGRPLVKTLHHLYTSARQTALPQDFETFDWLVIRPDDSMQFLTDAEAKDSFFDGFRPVDSNAQGPVIIFSLAGVARAVLDRLPRPPFKVSE